MMLGRSLASMCMLGLAACAAPGAPAAGTSGGAATAAPGLGGTRWTGVTEPGLDARAAPRLEFLDGGRVAGFTGCNMLSGEWRMEGAQVRFGGIATTKRMCLGPEAEVEKRLVAVLGAGTSVSREGAKLVLTGPGGARFEFVPATP